jgi:hypothetical protein
MRRFVAIAFLLAGLALEGYNAWLSRVAQHNTEAGTIHAMDGFPLPPAAKDGFPLPPAR